MSRARKEPRRRREGGRERLLRLAVRNADVAKKGTAIGQDGWLLSEGESF